MSFTLANALSGLLQGAQAGGQQIDAGRRELAAREQEEQRRAEDLGIRDRQLNIAEGQLQLGRDNLALRERDLEAGQDLRNIQLEAAKFRLGEAKMLPIDRFLRDTGYDKLFESRGIELSPEQRANIGSSLMEMANVARGGSSSRYRNMSSEDAGKLLDNSKKSTELADMYEELIERQKALPDADTDPVIRARIEEYRNAKAKLQRDAINFIARAESTGVDEVALQMMETDINSAEAQIQAILQRDSRVEALKQKILNQGEPTTVVEPTGVQAPLPDISNEQAAELTASVLGRLPSIESDDPNNEEKKRKEKERKRLEFSDSLRNFQSLR